MSLNCYRIIAIDDDPGMHELFCSMLAPACVPGAAPGGDRPAVAGRFLSEPDFPTFEIDSAFQGEDGVAKVRSALAVGRPYTMAFVDMRMPPGIDGVETISRLWKQCFDLQIVICTGHTDLSWPELVRRFGHSDRLLILKKPFDMTEIRQVAYSLAEKWDLAHQAQGHLERLQRLVSERTAKLQKANISLQRKIIQNQQAERRLMAQYASGRALTEAPSPAEAVKRVLQIAGENLGWAWGALWQVDAAAGALRLTHHWTAPDAVCDEFRESSRQSVLATGVDLPGVVWGTGQPAWVQDLFQEALFPRATAASSDGLHGAVAFPVMVDTCFFGVIEFASREIRERDADQLQTFSVIASALGQYLERKLAEEQRKMMEVQLRHAQKLESIGQLAAGIAHEINTPTQYIGDNICFLQNWFDDLKGIHAQYVKVMNAAKDGPVPAGLIEETEGLVERADVDFLLSEIPKAISQTLEGVNRVAKIVRAMKDFSHPGTGEKTPVDLNQALETTLTVARNEWKYVARVETDFDPTLPLVPCLPGELNQVMLNLIVNAAHAIADVVSEDCHARGVITASTRLCGEWVEIRIQDTGRGIPENIRHKIYDPFFTTKPVGKGTGQGLAIAHSVIVEQHGGTLDFKTELGVGTVFIIRLPLQPSQGAKPHVKPFRIPTGETNFIRR
ncbi:MAG TPA: ATP-binding protein [Verrucomicrobiae bacterium]|nr:ATP-binding protein [Verrucomicrobiae bacterium]